jgi:hypothetical protein
MLYFNKLLFWMVVMAFHVQPVIAVVPSIWALLEFQKLPVPFVFDKVGVIDAVDVARSTGLLPVLETGKFMLPGSNLGSPPVAFGLLHIWPVKRLLAAKAGPKTPPTSRKLCTNFGLPPVAFGLLHMWPVIGLLAAQAGPEPPTSRKLCTNFGLPPVAFGLLHMWPVIGLLAAKAGTKTPPMSRKPCTNFGLPPVAFGLLHMWPVVGLLAAKAGPKTPPTSRKRCTSTTTTTTTTTTTKTPVDCLRCWILEKVAAIVPTPLPPPEPDPAYSPLPNLYLQDIN